MAFLLLVGAPAASADAPTPATSRWAPADTAAIHPGVQMLTRGAQCTGNFVFTDTRRRVYVGYSAHCAGLGEATDTDGCRSESRPLGTRVRFARGASLVDGGKTVGRGRLAYSSWRTMRRLGGRSANACAANDFALVRVGRAHRNQVNPSVPFWGGPVGLSDTPVAEGDRVYSWGQSSLRPTTLLSPRTGLVLERTNGPWGVNVYTLGPGIPGDSGSGFLDPDGRAFGTLSTLTVAPTVGSNGVGDLRRELRFAQRHSGIRGLRLVPGTEAFSPLL